MAERAGKIVRWEMSFGMTRRLEAGTGAGEFFRFEIGAEASVGNQNPRKVIDGLQEEILLASLEFQKKLGLK